MGLIDKYHVDSKYIIFEITENTYIPVSYTHLTLPTIA